MRKPNVDLESIARRHELRSVNKVVKRPGWEKLAKLQPKTVKKLG